MSVATGARHKHEATFWGASGFPQVGSANKVRWKGSDAGRDDGGMRDIELYRHLLGLVEPWKVSRVELSMKGQRVDVWVEHPKRTRFACSECNESLPVYDHSEERSWRHLDSCQFLTFLHARPSRANCATHGVRQARLAWAEPMARFTALFERLAIDVLKECDVEGACRILRLSRNALLEAAVDPAHVLPALVQTLAQSLRLPYVAVELRRPGRPAVAFEHGVRPGEATELALVHQGLDIGQLVLGGHREVDKVTAALLGDLAGQLAGTVHAVGLAEDLLGSREQPPVVAGAGRGVGGPLGVHQRSS